MKNIYFIHTYTGTVLSRIVRFYTKKPYSHISFSLDSSLNKMYSFGRLNPYNPFIGGFVIENVHKGTFKRFKKTKTVIYKYTITDEQYKKLKKDIRYFLKNHRKYKFNTLGLFMVMFNKKIERENHFYCAEFVKYCMEKEEIITNLPEVVKPEDFLKVKEMHKVYTGKLHDYCKLKSAA